MATDPRRRQKPGLLQAIRIDLVRLHESWMGLVYPRQRQGKHSVLGKWKPSSPLSRAGYNLWGVLGALLVGALYPFVVFGFAVRFYTSRINRAAASLGLFGVVVLTAIVWGGLTAFARFRFSTEGFLAVAAAGAVATVSAALAVLFKRVGGRGTTVVLAYPFAVTTLFLPPVVAALYSPTLEDAILARSDTIAIWLLENVLDYRNINDVIRASFELKGFAYVGMWFVIAVPVGWFLGILVTLANVVRPSGSTAEGNGNGTG